MKDSQIPYTIMDEHCDGFWHWHVFMEQGYIPASGNILLHIDHHDDFEAGGYPWDLGEMPRNAAEALVFTDKALGIADFIVPAVWQGIFSVVHIMKSLLPTAYSEQKMFVRRMGRNTLTTGKYMPLLHGAMDMEHAPDYQPFLYRNGGMKTGDPQAYFSAPLVLDVDLDYFCWDDSLSTVRERRIEITESAYREYWEDRNHPVRIIPRRIMLPEERDGKYYLVMREHLDPDPIPEDSLILARMDRLFRWLKEADIRPAAIDICRSSYSGYLPAPKAAFVEEEFLTRLDTAYPIKEIAV